MVLVVRPGVLNCNIFSVHITVYIRTSFGATSNTLTDRNKHSFGIKLKRCIHLRVGILIAAEIDEYMCLPGAVALLACSSEFSVWVLLSNHNMHLNRLMWMCERTCPHIMARARRTTRGYTTHGCNSTSNHDS